MIKEQDHFMAGVQHALRLPLRHRCAELTVLLDRGNLLELHSFFPVLVDNIFGPSGTLSWGLRTTSECSDQEDFRQLQHFLSPCGPVFKLIYTLLKDPNIRYEFPLAYLPIKIRQCLENSQGHPFYSDLLHVNMQTKQIVSLMLNSFDYYIFHFAYHLINPWQQRPGSSAMSSWNTVYYVLCCDYIIHFLPTDPGTVVLPAIYYNGKNPLQAAKGNLLDKPQSSGLITPKLASNPQEDNFQNNLDIHHPRNDIWRSETVLTVFTDMWLHNNQVTESATSFNSTINTPPNSRCILHNELPTGEYMRIVRVLIKQLHAFHISVKADDTHLGELKKISIPMIQGKFYTFLRNLIHRWPLDGSFRLVLELWLTYIQPWRYPPSNLIKQLNKKQINPDIEDISTTPQHEVDPEFVPFIADNLLAYVVIFQQLLPRFLRVDLVSPKMSLMLYRIAKVFDQPNLPKYLREIEQCVDNNSSPTHKYSNDWATHLPPLSPTSNWSTNINLQKNSNLFPSVATNRSSGVHNTNFIVQKKWAPIVRQKIFDLEGPNFCYKPLLTDPPAPELVDLLHYLKHSIKNAEDIVQEKEKEEQEMFSSFWGSIKYYFGGSETNDEFSLKERQKVPLHLQVALQNLVDMFNISNEFLERDFEPSTSFVQNSINTSNDFKFLTRERIRARARNIRYEGDPDLCPIQSMENAFLVRTLYQIALKINEIYGPYFYQLYHSPTFMGRLSRGILSAPITTYRYDKTTPGSPRVGSNLPPRLSLRFLANYKFLGYLFFGAFLSWIFGYRIELYFIFLLLIVLFYKSFKALWSREISVRHNYPTQGFGNISFNDSF